MPFPRALVAHLSRARLAGETPSPSPFSAGDSHEGKAPWRGILHHLPSSARRDFEYLLVEKVYIYTLVQ